MSETATNKLIRNRFSFSFNKMKLKKFKSVDNLNNFNNNYNNDNNQKYMNNNTNDNSNSNNKKLSKTQSSASKIFKKLKNFKSFQNEDLTNRDINNNNKRFDKRSSSIVSLNNRSLNNEKLASTTTTSPPPPPLKKTPSVKITIVKQLMFEPFMKKKLKNNNPNNNHSLINKNKDKQQQQQEQQQKQKFTAADNDDDNNTLIMSNEYIKDNDQQWHLEHFNCVYCNKSLTTARYALATDEDKNNNDNDNNDNNQTIENNTANDNNNNGKPMCIECYEQRHSNVCEECQKPIGVNTKDLSFNDRHWHEKCFVCSQCKFDLFNKPFGSRSDRIFCASCYDNKFAPRCCKCLEIFEPGQKKLDFRDNLYHDTCFNCKKCQQPIGSQTFLQKDNNIYCSECYKNEFATKCFKCNEIIINDGIVYRDKPWHGKCFCCTECGRQLSKIQFTSHDDQPYCRECNAQLFAPKCDDCKKPIIGSTGRKMVTHGNRKWHQSCFVCKDCRTELGGKGFVPLLVDDHDNIIENNEEDHNDQIENIYCTPCAQVIMAKQWSKIQSMAMNNNNNDDNNNNNNNYDNNKLINNKHYEAIDDQQHPATSAVPTHVATTATFESDDSV